MSDFRWPFSGNVTQPWTWWLGQSLGQQGFINIKQMVSSDSEMEQKIITQVAGYGKQLGRMMDVLCVFIRNSDVSRFSADDKQALHQFESMAGDIAAAKGQYGTTAEEALAGLMAEARQTRDTDARRRLIEQMRRVIEKLDSESGTGRSPLAGGSIGSGTNDAQAGNLEAVA